MRYENLKAELKSAQNINDTTCMMVYFRGDDPDAINHSITPN